MTEVVAERMAALNAHETRFMFESFDHAAAWQLGKQMVERALGEALPVIIDIRKPGLVLYVLGAASHLTRSLDEPPS